MEIFLLLPVAFGYVLTYLQSNFGLPAQWQSYGVVGLLMIAVSAFMATKVVPRSTMDNFIEHMERQHGRQLEQMQIQHKEMTDQLTGRVDGLERQIHYLQQRDESQVRAIIEMSGASNQALTKLSDALEAMRHDSRALREAIYDKGYDRGHTSGHIRGQNES